MFASELKARVQQGHLTLGPILTLDFWPGYLEIFKAEGMHFALLDMEHGSASLRTAEELCRTARLLDFPLILRPEASLYHVLRKYLDMGPAGLMIPWTERQEQVEALRQAAFLPPTGKRGPGGPAIFANRSLDRSGWAEIESSLFFILQFESPAGLANLTSLAAAEWIDAVMVGPYDLSLSLDRCGQLNHPDVTATIREIHAQSGRIGKPCGMVVGSPEDASAWIDLGFHFFILPEPTTMVRQHARFLVNKIKESFGSSAARIEKSAKRF